MANAHDPSKLFPRSYLLSVDNGDPNAGSGGGGGDATGSSVRDTIDAAVQSTQQRAATAAAQPPLTAPEHWPNEDKTLFTKHPRDIQDYLLKRDKSYMEGHQKVSNELAEFKKWGDPIKQLFAPYADGMKKANLSEHQIITNYINAEKHLRADPVQAIVRLAKAYNASPEKLLRAFESSADPARLAAEADLAADPEKKALIDRLTRLEQTLQTEQQSRQQQQDAALHRALETFAGTKGEDGMPSHPHMSNEQVLKLMQTYIEGGLVDLVKAGSLQAGLKQAYDMAVHAFPETREALLKSAQDAQAKKAAEEAKAKIEAKKKAGVSVSGASPETDEAASARRKPSSVRQLLRESATKAGYLNA